MDILDYTNIAGIYKLTCKENNKIYIGKSVNLQRRFNYHKYCEGGKVYEGILQRAIKKYKWESFKIEILEVFENFNKETDHNTLLEKEKSYIEKYNSTDNTIGYNMCLYSTDRTGVPHSEKTKEKMRGPKSKEHKEKIRLSRLGKPNLNRMGKPCSDELKERLRVINTGKKMSEESKEKMRQARLGKGLSDETKEKLRQANLGKKMSTEAIEKMRQANLGKKMSDETKEKLRNAFIGKPRSEETKEKIRQGNLGKKHNKNENRTNITDRTIQVGT